MEAHGYLVIHVILLIEADVKDTIISQYLSQQVGLTLLHQDSLPRDEYGTAESK